MGRRKLEIKRIENKSSRLVAFSKRRTGLIKKARHLSMLCDVDVAVIVFSAHGKLYEFCSNGSNSVAHLLARHEKSRLEPESRTITEFRTCEQLLQAVDSLVEDNYKSADVSVAVSDMTQLEQQLRAALLQTRSRKTQLMMDYISTLQQQETNLNKENEEIGKQIASVDPVEHIFDEGGGLNDLATNKMNSPQQVHGHVTLPLFKA